jgi:DNA-binding CsgD family transcriptional regulator
MGRLIKKNKNNVSFEEGEIYYKWENSRIQNNKNVIVVTTGPTGSGKSMLDLRRAEISYRKRFNKPFPVETNVCFSIAELMKRINSKNLKKGEVIILEEAGFNAGSQDWQNKTTKIFNYLLQTFRSMNICLYMNLPVLSMLAKQARQLVHMHFETQGINFEDKKVKVKPLVHQLNQHSGKSYWKFLRIKLDGKVKTVQRMLYGLPDASIINNYEFKKAKFLSDMTEEFSNELESKERDKLNKMARRDLTAIQMEVFNLINEGKNPKEVAEIREVSLKSTYDIIKSIKKKGYTVKINNRYKSLRKT